MNDDKHAHPVDHQSDPAHTPGDGWGEEGGASHLGPATHTKANDDDGDDDGADDNLEEDFDEH